MSMASMVQNFASQEHRDQYNLEGYASHLANFNSAPPSSTLFPCSCNEHKLNGAADPIWQPNKGSPLLQGPFTPAPLTLTSSACTHPDDHSSYNMDSIARCVNADNILSFTNSASFDFDFPLSEENQLLELMGLQRKLTLYSSYAGTDHDDHDLSQDSMAAAAHDEKESFLQASSYGDEAVKLSNLPRSFTFPPGTGARCESSCGPARSIKSPLMLLACDNAEVRNPNNQVKHFNQQRLYRENSSAATTSCSNGDENESHKGKDTKVKIEVSEISQCMLGNREQQGCIEQIGAALSSRGYKQNRKRTANMNKSNTSVKVARLETPPDVVHVRARRGQATDSHSLAERVRREKISQRMKVLQEIVPGCHKVLGKAMMLDEIINYVKSLQKQVEFLSMKLAAANQVGMASMIANEVKFLLPNMELFGEFSSACQAMKSEPLMNSLIQ